MKKINKIVYEITDGLTFDNKDDAEKHEDKINNVRAFKVYFQPDLNEVEGGFQSSGYILVH